MLFALLIAHLFYRTFISTSGGRGSNCSGCGPGCAAGAAVSHETWYALTIIDSSNTISDPSSNADADDSIPVQAQA